MGRFGFPIPGRKKAPPPPITVTEPMTKAHKILGSVPLNIDSSKSWDGQSLGKAERLDGAESRSYTDSVRRQPTVGMTTPTSSAEPWGDESAIIPSSFKISATGGDDAFTETSTILRSKQSSSTLKSWYDKSKMPLSVSQQTSASAMAKGLPSKAQRMLDMDNSHAVPRTKKPSKLDISNLLAGSRSPKQKHDPVLGSDYMTRSPSLLSPPLSSGRRPRMVGKHTKATQNESLAETGGRPNTSGSNTHRGKGPHLNGLPDLYEHYEQMSFRQIMDADLELEDEPIEPPTKGLGIVPTAEPTIHRQQAGQNTQAVQALSPQAAQRSLLAVTKPVQQPAFSEDAESVSSRHTKTSRASIITQSFQDSDLQETSVLMLSSDSEDDEYEEIETKSQNLTLTRPISRIPETMALLEQGSMAGPLTPNSAEKRMSKASKRTSFAPSVTYLGVPGTQPSSLHTPDSQTTFAATNSASASSTRGSIISSSSASSAPSWQTRSDYGNNDAYVVAMLPTKTKASSCEDSDEERGDSTAELQRDTLIAQTDQPTPPLSPTSVDFYIRSAHSSVDGATAHNRFMAVTRQEEMLLSALRHKRQTMRESRMGNQQAAETQQSPPQTKHLSKASDATITNLLDFDFPVPPSSSNSTPRLPPLGNENDGVNQALSAETPPSQSDDDEKATMSPILSPAPIYPRQSQMFLKSSTYQPPEAEKKLHTGDAYSPPQEALNAEDLDELLYSISQASSRTSPVARRSSRRVSSSSFGKNSRHDRRLPKLAMSSNMDPVMESEDQAVAPGIPRPDSPISPSVFPMPPTMAPLNKRMARLSAVGGVRLGDAPDWWKNEDTY